MRIAWFAGLVCGALAAAPALAKPQSEGEGGGQRGQGRTQAGGEVKCENRTVDNYPACAPSNRARVRVCTGPDGQTITFLRCLN